MSALSGASAPIADPLALRAAPEYDPDMPVLDRAAVVAVCRLKGIDTVTERAVKYASLDGVLASHKVANKLRWSETDVLAWLRGTRRAGGGAS